MNGPAGPQDPELISYQNLRRAIGWIGVALPFVVSIGKAVSQGLGLERSISCYYYTDMRNWLVGSLCAIAVFLMCYRGYKGDKDLVAGRLACVFALGVAFCPTTPWPDPSTFQKVVGRIHLTCAALLFLTFAYFCWFLFTKTDPRREFTKEKGKRNKVYQVCAVLIVAFLVLIAAVELTPLGAMTERFVPVFWLESLTIWAFGASWLVKGEVILKDK